MNNLTLEECRNYLKKFLEICVCHVCHEPLRSPDIAVCVRGHAVCSSCKHRLATCALCRSFYCDEAPTTLCQMVDVLPRFCRYNYGCNRILGDNDDHESWCEFRLLPCFYCNFSIECHSMLIHLINAHKMKPQGKGVWAIDFERYNFQCIEGTPVNMVSVKLLNDHLFIFHYHYAHQFDKSLCVDVTFWPVKRDSNTFIFTLQIFTEDEKVSLSVSREEKIEPNKKTLIFNIGEFMLKTLNGKNVVFRTSIEIPKPTM